MNHIFNIFLHRSFLAGAGILGSFRFRINVVTQKIFRLDLNRILTQPYLIFVL